MISFHIHSYAIMNKDKEKNCNLLDYPRLQSQLSYINTDLNLNDNIYGYFHIISDSSIHHQQTELMNFKLKTKSNLSKSIRECLKQADLWDKDLDSIAIHFEYFSNKKWWIIKNDTTIDDMIIDEKKNIIVRLRLLHTKRQYY